MNIRFHVHDHCVTCNLCVDLVPEVFAYDHTGLSTVVQQPTDADQHARAQEAAELCPVDAIDTL